MRADICKKIFKSDSFGILHTEFYRTFNTDGILYKISCQNKLEYGTPESSEGLIYKGKYATKLDFYMISLYYKECGDVCKILPIDDLIVFGVSSDWWPESPISDDIKLCIEKTINGWKRYITDLTSEEIIKYFDNCDLVNEANVDIVKEDILDWLRDTGQQGATSMISSTIIYEAKNALKRSFFNISE